MVRHFVIPILLCGAVSAASAQVPPAPGYSFPPGYPARFLEERPEPLPDERGWAPRMRERRDAQLDIASKGGEAALAQDNFGLPVFLASYSDMPGVIDRSAIQEHLYGANPSGNVTEFYEAVSHGQFALTGEVYGWYQAPQPRAYYAGDVGFGSGPFPANPAGLVRAIVEAADPDVDFGLYDNDGPDGIPNSGDDDGFVDGVLVIFAGGGAESGNPNIWSHQSELGPNAYFSNDRTPLGQKIRVNTYAVSPESVAEDNESRSEPAAIGVFVHEFGHVLGLPDLYDITGADDPPDNDASAGIGWWGLMGGGAWGGGPGGSPARPASMTAWSKMEMGWLTPTIISEEAPAFPLRSAASHPDVALLWESRFEHSRYFLVENRHPEGVDADIPGGGLLVYHVDEHRRLGRAAYSVGWLNSDEEHKLVDIEEADGRDDMDQDLNGGDAGDVFPGSSGQTSFSGATYPATDDYAGQPTGVRIENISAPGETMTADLVPRPRSGYTIAYDDLGMNGQYGQIQSSLHWAGVEFTAPEDGTFAGIDLGVVVPGATYDVAVYRTVPGGEEEDVPLLSYSATASSDYGWQTFLAPENAVEVFEGEDFFVAYGVTGVQAISIDAVGTRDRRSWSLREGGSWSAAVGLYGGDINLRALINVSDTGTSIAAAETPDAPRLGAPWPNPTTGTFRVAIGQPDPAGTLIEVYDLLGRRVHRETVPSGSTGSVAVTPNRLAAGVYRVVLRGERGGPVASRPLVVVRPAG